MREINRTAVLRAVSTEAPSRGQRGHGRARLCARDEQGGSLIEFAFLLPVLMLLVTGITTFGITMNNYLELTQAVGIGGMQLSVSRGNTTDPCSTVSTAVSTAAGQLTASNITYSIQIYTSPSSSTTYSGASCSSSSTSTGAAGNLTQGQAAVVTATYPCSLAVYGINYAPSCTLTAQVTEIIQ